MSQGEGFPPLLKDPGGGSSTNIEDGCKADTANGELNVFGRSEKVPRSPVQDQGVAVGSNIASTSDAQDAQLGLGLRFLFTPKANSSNSQAEQQGPQLSRTMEVKRKVYELYEFIQDKHNVHHKIRDLVTSIRSGMLAVDREQQAWRVRAEKAEKELTEKIAIIAAVEDTPKGPNPRGGKRDRETPGDDEVSKKQKEDDSEVNENAGESSGWLTIQNKTEKKLVKKKNEEKKKEERKKEEKKKEEKKKEDRKKEEQKKEEQKKEDKKDKPKPRRERNKGDALIVEAKDKTSYAALLRKVREDPELKELGDNVVKTRRTQKGEMLFELKKDPSVKSSAFKELVAKALGNEVSVRALSQETVVECRDLDEITTEDELRGALKVQCKLGDEAMVIRMRKAYGGTQTAAIRLSTDAANKLLEVSKVKVGWSVCSFKATPRVSKEMERCFKCMGFGHLARNCKGPDRSRLCRKCGEKDHFARDCTKQPRCLLCEKQDGNDHLTGGFRCPVYKKAMASRQ